ncbi:hypothetical protein GOP47_0009829 [Adiantum capillus-veneris]|uniref:Diacylglycerol kinase n=1 Tax=Adiantum capillus-veneris TaxID=13818 RepID=A0A9D4UY76_ADICA|nr:hypothetical protein GOP47_0009829 [Adiantum capillus-veneris]
MRYYQDPEFILEMRIPDYVFGDCPLDATKASDIRAPLCPLLAFVNSKSGGQLGSELLKSYRVLLSPQQIFDLTKEKPDKVLRVFYNRLEKLKGSGDKIAESILSSLRIIVAGGDGTAGWLLSVIGDLKLSHPPPVATVPLGTGNNLPFSFGWGKKNPGTDLESAKKFLFEVYRAKPMNIDSWHVVMKMTTPLQSLDPVQVPHSLHPFERVSESDALHEADTQVFRGGFWNYFSIGMDAQVAYEFHKKRQEHPEFFKHQLMNQGAYAMIVVTQGWFLANVIHPSSRNINQMGDIYIQRQNDQVWKKLKISKSIRSIVMLNLPSFSGGLNPWGAPHNDKSSKRKLTAAFVNDGRIELVGFRDGWHGLALLTPKGHGTRLAQAHKVRIEFHKGFASETYMRMDGEPWMQPLPADDDSVTTVEITSLGQAAMLTTKKCIAQCVPDDTGGKVDLNGLTTPSRIDEMQATGGDDIEIQSVLSSSAGDNSEVRRKFGAAETFKRLTVQEQDVGFL